MQKLRYYRTITHMDNNEAPLAIKRIELGGVGAVSALAGILVARIVDTRTKGPYWVSFEAQKYEDSAQEVDQEIVAIRGYTTKLEAYHIDVSVKDYNAEITRLTTSAQEIRAKKPTVDQGAVKMELVGGATAGALLGLSMWCAAVKLARRRKEHTIPPREHQAPIIVTKD